MEQWGGTRALNTTENGGKMEQWEVQEQSLKMKMEGKAHTDFAKIKT